MIIVNEHELQLNVQVIQVDEDMRISYKVGINNNKYGNYKLITRIDENKKTKQIHFNYVIDPENEIE